MKCCSIVSGSSGNCIYIETDQTRILVDAGNSGRIIQEGLKLAGVDPKTLHAIFVTHEHGDHTAGVGVLSRRFRLPIFANQGTWNGMHRRIGKIAKENQKFFKTYQTFQFRDLIVTPFATFHDAQDSVGYSFQSQDGKISVVTDTGILDDRLMDTIQGSQIYYFESNHDIDMLMEGPYPPDLKARILSEFGHLSNLQAGEGLVDLLQGNQEKVILAHMSIENNLEDICHDTVVHILTREGIDTQRDQKIIVAPRYTPSEMFSTQDILPASNLNAFEQLSLSEVLDKTNN